MCWKYDCESQYNYLERVVLTTDGHLYAQEIDPERKTRRMFRLDRTSSKWKEIQAPPSSDLYAADGDRLVFTNIASGAIQLRWFKQPPGETVPQ
jgi:hypothetical protein